VKLVPPAADLESSQQPGNGQAEPASSDALDSWVIGGVHVAGINPRRRVGKHIELKQRLADDTQMTSSSEPLRALVSALGRQRLGQALRGLGGKEGEVVRLAYVEGRTNKEIAERLGISVSTVNRRLRSALASMETQIGRAGRALSALTILGLIGLSAPFAKVGGVLSRSIDVNLRLAASLVVGTAVVSAVAFANLAAPTALRPSIHPGIAGSAPFRGLEGAGQLQPISIAEPTEGAPPSLSDSPGSALDVPSPSSAQGQSGLPLPTGGRSAPIGGGDKSNNGCDGNPTSAPAAAPVGPRTGHPTTAPVTHPTAGGCRP
jgi:RNA polymerase sigma factor (sigma-70 family)